MEDILAKLLVSDNESIKQGTAELREAFKKPEHVSYLVQIIMGSSQNPEIRQYATVLLKKRYSKSANWLELPEKIRIDFKNAIIQCLINEPDKQVKQSIALLVGVIAKQEFSNNRWPEILQLIERLVLSSDNQEKLLGLFILSHMTDEASKAFSKHILAIIALLDHIFQNIQNITPDIGFYTISVMNNLMQELSHSQELVNAYKQLLPNVMSMIKAMSTSDPKKAIKNLEIIEGLCEYNITIIVCHIKLIVDVCLEIANDASLDDELRAKTISIIGWLIKAKKKVIIKHKLIEPIIGTVFNMMSSKPDDDENESYFPVEEDEEVPVTCASETLDALAINLPPESLVQPLFHYIEPALRGTDIYKKKAAYLSIAILAEGCSEYVRTKYLESFLHCICQGITDPAPVVRNAALFALGQFAEFLQPDVSTYSSQLLPVLFEYLQQICNEIKEKKKETQSPDRIFYALETFCENLELELLPYLPKFMERLFEILIHENTSAHLRELALSAIGAAANACKENMGEYFSKIIELINPYLMDGNTQDPDVMSLKIQAVDTLGVLARTVGHDQFAPIAQRVLEYALGILCEASDPDLKKTTYSLCASISTVMKDKMAFALPFIIGCIIQSMKNCEGIISHYKDDDINAAYPTIEETDVNEEEDIENTDNEEESDDGFVGYSVENSYVTEKEEAILALKEFAENTGKLFNPYLENCFKEVMEFITYLHEDVREAAVETLTQFVINFWNIKTEEGAHATRHCLTVLMPRFSTIICSDEEHKVVIAATNSLTILLKTLKQDLIWGPEPKEAIMNCISQILEGGTVCQDNEESENEEAVESEQDEILIEYAGDLLTNFGKVAPKEDFTNCFKQNLNGLMNIFKTSDNVGRKSFVVGTIAECFEGLKDNVRLFPELYEFFMKCSKHSDEEIRNNAIYGIGEMILHGGEVMHPYYMEVLNHFSNAFSNETHLGARDNIVGAIARMIIANHYILPLAQIYPIFVQQLPLKQDFAEYKSVFNSVLTLYRISNPEVFAQIMPLTKVAFMALNEKELEDAECRAVIVEFLKCVQRDFDETWVQVMSETPSEQLASISQYF